MITLKELQIEGFRSFKEQVTVSFPEKGAMLIQGMDSINKTSSGSGKSSILLAIEFALGICSLPATELTNWSSKKLSVLLKIADESNEYVITRDPKLGLSINGVEYDGKSTGAEEKLQEILGLPKDLVKTLVSRPQRENGRFVNFTDSQKKEFLTQTLQLEGVEQAYDSLVTESKRIQADYEALDRELSLIKENAISVKSELENMEKQEVALPTQEYDIDKARAHKEEALVHLDMMQNSSALVEFEQETQAARKQLQDIESASRKIHELNYESRNIDTKLASMKQDILMLMEAKCPTCLREWTTDSQRSMLETKKAEFVSLSTKKESNVATVRNLEPLMSEKAKIESQLNEIMKKANEHNNKILYLKSEIQNADKVFRLVEEQQKMVEKAKSDHQSRIEFKKDQLEKVLSKAKEKFDLGQSKKIELEVTELASELIGRSGFLGVIFDEILLEIESKTNDMLGCLPNVNRFVLSLSSDMKTQKGTVKKKINMSILKNGQSVSLRSLSGGQQAAIELCVDLAVGEVLRSRSGSSLGWVALDEAMDGLDIEPKASAIEMIKNQINGQVIIIDHATEIKEGFSSVIEVKFDGHTSYVEQ